MCETSMSHCDLVGRNPRLRRDGGAFRDYPLPSFCLILMLFLALPAFGWTEEMHPAEDWHLLYPKIRDRLVPKDEAGVKLKELERALGDFYLRTRDRKEEPLLFPLKGYDATSIGGKRGNGYQAQGYDFFDGSGHKGHPGHDIFIRDRNQDGLDDVTGEPVMVVSSSSGIVVSVNIAWAPSSPIRGGNYIWIYEPVKSRYFYYAHLNEVFVRVGQIVSIGNRLGTVGRTGVNAYRTRSPTHLHFTIHQSGDGYPKPIDPYPELVKVRESK